MNIHTDYIPRNFSLQVIYMFVATSVYNKVDLGDTTLNLIVFNLNTFKHFWFRT